MSLKEGGGAKTQEYVKLKLRLLKTHGEFLRIINIFYANMPKIALLRCLHEGIGNC